MYKVDRRLYLTRDNKIVDLSEREKATQLFKVKGGPVSQAEIDKYGAQLEEYIPELKKAKKAKTEKKRAPAKNKMKAPEEDKSGEKPETEG